MIILPDKNICHTKFLMPVPKKQWMIPSLVQPKDQFGKENRTLFNIKALTNDGKVCWHGIYEDRDDFDAVLWAIATDTLKYQKELWPLSTPNWDPWLSEIITYIDFISVNLTASAGVTGLTYPKPTDWTDYNSTIECLGGGGSGGISKAQNSQTVGTANNATGGGGGAYSRIVNFSFSGENPQFAAYFIGGAGTTAAGTAGATIQNLTGGTGGNTVFNTTTTSPCPSGIGNSQCAAQGGSGGSGIISSASVVGSGAAGGSIYFGNAGFSGGSGGNIPVNFVRCATGGGGAGGSGGAGFNGDFVISNSTATNGGGGGVNAQAATGGTGGSGLTTTPGGAGTAGTYLVGGLGPGGGGGGCSRSDTGAIVGGAAGNYGAGSGAAINYGGSGGNLNATSGAAAAGAIIINYDPRRRASVTT